MLKLGTRKTSSVLHPWTLFIRGQEVVTYFVNI